MTRIGPNPFTPRSGQEPKAFLGREREIGIFEKHLTSARKKRFDHFVVIGEWGTGKTTLLKEFRKIAHSKKVLTSFLSNHEFSNSDLISPAVQLLTQIPRNVPVKFDRLKRFGKYLQGVGITLPVIGGGIEIKDKKRFDGDPQVLLLDGLMELWKELREETDAFVVFLDDVQHYEHVPQFLGIIKNVLSDEDLIKKTGYLFILSTTEEAWSAFLKRNHPIGRYFIPILRVGQLKKDEAVKIVQESLKETGVTFSMPVIQAVYEYTEGHPFQLQIFCSYLYENQLDGKVGPKQMDVALTQTLQELGSIILDPLVKAASDSERGLLEAMAHKYRIYTFEQMRRIQGNAGGRMSKGTLAAAASRLVEKGLLKKSGRGSYRIVNKLFNEFIVRG